MGWVLPRKDDGVQRDPIESSNLKSVGYDGSALEIEFKSGVVWRYADVSPEDHKRLLEAESKGSFFSAAIKPKYKGVKVLPEEANG